MNEESKNNMSSLKISNVTLACLIIVALVLSYLLYQKITNTAVPSPQYTDTQTPPLAAETKNNTPPKTDGQLASLPIPKNHPRVESVEPTDKSLRYFFSGMIKEVNSVQEGTRIVLENSKELPGMLLPKSSNPSMITLVPNGTPKIELSSPAALKPGVYVQVLMYYHAIEKTWLLRDIYIPREKNQ